MRDIYIAHLDKARPVLILTRPQVRGVMSKVTVAPITGVVKGLSTELLVGPRNGLDLESAVSLDNITTIPAATLGRHAGYLFDDQESDLAKAVANAFALQH